jgi:hypothetical protein
MFARRLHRPSRFLLARTRGYDGDGDVFDVAQLVAERVEVLQVALLGAAVIASSGLAVECGAASALGAVERRISPQGYSTSKKCRDVRC